MNTQKPSRPLQILLADDGSQHSLAAAALIGDLPLPKDSSITILGVLTPRESSNHAVLQAALDQAQKLLQDKDLIAQSELRLGYPAEVLIEFAQLNNPDLIVMGAKGLRSTLSILLGGVAQQVVEYADHPVLIVRAPYIGLKRILLVTDGSVHSQHALEYLAGTTQQAPFPLPVGIELYLVHILPPVLSPERITRAWPMGPEYMLTYLPDTETEKAMMEEEENQGRALLEQTQKDLQQAGLAAKSELLRGDAATEILEFAKKYHIDLIVAGSRGLSPVRGWLLGSVSRKLVHYAECSVLVVK